MNSYQISNQFTVTGKMLYDNGVEIAHIEQGQCVVMTPKAYDRPKHFDVAVETFAKNANVPIVNGRV